MNASHTLTPPLSLKPSVEQVLRAFLAAEAERSTLFHATGLVISQDGRAGGVLPVGVIESLSLSLSSARRFVAQGVAAC